MSEPTCKECGIVLGNDDDVDSEFCSRACKEEYEESSDNDPWGWPMDDDWQYDPDPVDHMDQDNGL